MQSTNGTSGINKCSWCGLWHTGMCTKVEEIEYYQDGTVKRVKLKTIRPIKNAHSTSGFIDGRG